MNDRHTADTITDDALDALYEQLDAAEESEAQQQLATAREAFAAATTRAARAEAALDRVRAVHPQEGDYCAVCTEDFGRLSAPWPCPTIRALDGEQPAPEPCDGRPCAGTGCSHEQAAAALTAHDEAAGLYTAPAPAATEATTGHVYLSTGCLHSHHDYCQNHTGHSGTKTPAQCKFCAAPCTCGCHQDGAQP
jgi:hypothetical protein